MITGTFAVTLSGNFLPMQLIYGGKINQSIPRYNFPENFCLSANPKHFLNTEESLKYLDAVIIPYVVKERSKSKLLNDQKALMIMDVFTGQLTPQVIQHYAESNTLIVNVPRNMTKYYQLPDLTVNGYSKRFLKNKFNEQYSFQVSKQLADGVILENVQVKLNLTIFKPIHAGWFVEFYNHMTTNKGCDIIKNGWKAAGITDAIRLGLNNLPSVDPFDEMDSMLQPSTASADQNQLVAISRITLQEI